MRDVPQISKHVFLALAAVCLSVVSLGVSATDAVAATGRGKVFKKTPGLTPVAEEVVLEDLDGSGHLKNPYLVLLLLAGSAYNYPAVSLSGNFVYEPVSWGVGNISPEGIRFDQVSTYDYLTSARKYFETRFGFRQSRDGRTPDLLRVKMFVDEPGIDRPQVRCVVTGCEMLVTVPGDPDLAWAPNYYRSSTTTHEYAHLVFDYRQQFQFQSPSHSEAQAVNEGFAIFWPATIIDEPRGNRSTQPPWLPVPDLRNDVFYDPNITGVGLRLANQIGALTSTLCDLREHPRVGKTNTERLLYEAMRLVPHTCAVLADVPAKLIDAKAILSTRMPSTLHERYLSGTFARHRIPLKRNGTLFYATFTEQSHTLPGSLTTGVAQDVRVVFQNNSPLTVDAPKLIAFNPLTNPNVDQPSVIMSYVWAPSPVYPSSASRLSPQGQVSFSFRLTAPSNPGTYACDWALMTPDGQLGPIVSKDVTVTADSTRPTEPTFVSVSLASGAFQSSWTSASDPESGIAEYQYALGTSAGSSEAIPWTSTGLTTYVRRPVTIPTGRTYYLSVRAKNRAGLLSVSTISSGLAYRAVP